MPDRYHYLSLLGLKRGAQKADIKQAYYDLVKVWHPDRFTHDPALAAKAQEKLKEINEAYEILMRLPEDAPRPAPGPRRTRSHAFYEPVVRGHMSSSFWNRRSLVFFFLLLFSAILFKAALAALRGGSPNSAPGKSVRNIA